MNNFYSLFLFLHSPIYTGFFFKIWDQIFGTNYQGPCDCFICREANPKTKRSLADWDKAKLNLPDYSVLLSLKWWMTSDTRDLLVGGGKLK